MSRLERSVERGVHQVDAGAASRDNPARNEPPSHALHDQKRTHASFRLFPCELAPRRRTQYGGRLRLSVALENSPAPFAFGCHGACLALQKQPRIRLLVVISPANGNVPLRKPPARYRLNEVDAASSIIHFVLGDPTLRVAVHHIDRAAPILSGSLLDFDAHLLLHDTRCAEAAHLLLPSSDLMEFLDPSLGVCTLAELRHQVELLLVDCIQRRAAPRSSCNWRRHHLAWELLPDCSLLCAIVRRVNLLHEAACCHVRWAHLARWRVGATV
mmetsp:Transcript_26330/g.61776  ORF Transcript_26330/g.61776 Transcript_26330/m.61776 type:complete len:271 (-) Transcript_26330:1389-2201(-)